jgi:hypothetical protein
MQDQTREEHSVHYCGLSGGHGQGANSTGVTVTSPIAYPGTNIPRPYFHRPSYPIYEEGSSFYSHQQESAYAILPQVLSCDCDYTSKVPATVSDKVFCDFEENQDTGTYPANAPAEQWDAQVS